MVPQIRGDGVGQGGGEACGQMLGVPFDNHTAYDRVTDRQEGADQLVEVGRPDMVAGSSEPASEELVAAGRRTHEVTAVLEPFGSLKARQRVRCMC